MKVAALGIAGVAALTFGVIVMVMWSLGLGWFAGEASLRSFGHVRQTYAEAYDDVRALDALASNVCVYSAQVRQARAAGDESAVQQREAQVLAFEGRYNSLRGEYDAYMQDHFRGGVIRPRRLPLPYPALTERMKEVC